MQKLTVFLMYERIKGKESFWYPYFNVMTDPESITIWPEGMCAELQDP